MDVTITHRGAAPLDAITATDGNVRHGGRVAYYGELAFVAIDDVGRNGVPASPAIQQAIAAKLRDEYRRTAVFCPETACWQMHLLSNRVTRSLTADVVTRVLFFTAGVIGGTAILLLR